MRIPTRFLFLLAVLPVWSQAGPISLDETDAAVTIRCGDSPVLVYHKAEVSPPEGVDPVFKRSGFIHPLCAPSGGEVTGIHPDDHYHHLGLWHAWVKTEWNGKHYDFWNLKDKLGRVRFARMLDTHENEAGAGFTAAQQQVAYVGGPDAEPTVILEEKFTVDVAREDGAYLIDYIIEQTNVTAQPLELPAYRYGGGVAWRGPHSWNKENSDYLTSEGKDRTNSHATRSRWCAVFGPAEGSGKEATVAFLGHPSNFDAPEPMRTWDNGKMFFNYVPSQEVAWEIPAGKTVTLRYRLAVSDGKPDAETIEAQWKAFAETK